MSPTPQINPNGPGEKRWYAFHLADGSQIRHELYGYEVEALEERSAGWCTFVNGNERVNVANIVRFFVVEMAPGP